MGRWNGYLEHSLVTLRLLAQAEAGRLAPTRPESGRNGPFFGLS